MNSNTASSLPSRCSPPSADGASARRGLCFRPRSRTRRLNPSMRGWATCSSIFRFVDLGHHSPYPQQVAFRRALAGRARKQVERFQAAGASDRRLLEWLAHSLGGSVQTRSKRPRRPRATHRDSFAVVARHPDAGNQRFSVLVCPPQMRTPRGAIAPKFRGSEQRGAGLAEAYMQIASDLGCHYFDAETVTSVSAVDGVHLDSDQHWKLGNALAEIVSPILPAQNCTGELSLRPGSRENL